MKKIRTQIRHFLIKKRLVSHKDLKELREVYPFPDSTKKTVYRYCKEYNPILRHMEKLELRQERLFR